MSVKKRHINYTLFFLVAGIVFFSFIFFAALTAPLALKKLGNTNYFLIRQAVMGLGAGLILAIIAFKTPIEKIKKWAPLLLLANMVALFLVFIPGLRITAGGASRWLSMGFFSFQPSELLKLTAILYLSAWVASKLSEGSVSGWKSFTKKNFHNIIYVLVPFLVFLGAIFVAMYLQSDVSTLGIISLTLLAMYFSSRTPWWHTFLIVIAGLLTLFLLVKFEPYRFDRWMTLFNPLLDPLGKGLQLNQSLISLGSGGLFGKGLGMSAGKFFLPESMTDSIFAIIGEEFGIIGSFCIISAFIFLLWQGIKIAKNSNDMFSRMVAVGIVTWITLQAFINMASVSGMFPVAGIPLPFFSYGGTHLAVEMMAMGLLLNISKNT